MSLTCTASRPSISFAPPSLAAGHFAFARIQGNICLIQIDSPITSLGPVDVKIFRHEFITIFRFSEIKTLHPADICIIEEIDDSLTRYEEENDTVFLARDLMCRLRNLSDRRLPMQAKRYPTYSMGRRRES